MTNPTFDAAREALALDIWPLPVPRGAKAPNLKDWQNLRLRIDDLPEHFSNGSNLGLLMGVGPRPVADIDVDCREALLLSELLPPPATARVFGHKSKPRSHFLYRVSAEFKGKKFLDTAANPDTGKPDTLIELRGKGQQTIVPPSIHVNGEHITWDREAEFGETSHDELLSHVKLVAAGALLVRRWPSSPRHEARWSLSGALLRGGWTEDRVLRFVRAVVEVAQPGEREAVEKVATDIERWRDLTAQGENTVGLPRLAEMVGEDVAKQVSKWLELKTPATSVAGNLIVNKQGDPCAILANAVAILRSAPEWRGVLGFNEFTLCTVARKSPPWAKPAGTNWSNTDDLWLTEWLQHKRILVGPQVAADAVQAIAEENAFHPVKDYLAGLEWDGAARVGTWLNTYLGVADTIFARAVGTRWLISAIARIYAPGCRADHTLLLEGPQGIEKSTALRTLASDDWFTDHISDLDGKDSRLELHGMWIVELAELASVRRSLAEKVKTFLTATSDHFRPPYGRRAIHVPRSNVFAGSTNDATPFTDETGNRRFWPVRCGNINIEKLKADRDQLWADALQRYRNGDPWWLDSKGLNELAAAEQEHRYERGVWDDVILAWLENPEQRSVLVDDPNDRNGPQRSVQVRPFNSTADLVTVTDVLLHAVGKRLDGLTQADRNQVARCLAHAGWTVKRARDNEGSLLRFYARPIG